MNKDSFQHTSRISQVHKRSHPKHNTVFAILIMSLASIACDKDPDYINAEGQRCFINPYNKKHNCYGETSTNKKKSQVEKCDFPDTKCYQDQIEDLFNSTGKSKSQNDEKDDDIFNYWIQDLKDRP